MSYTMARLDEAISAVLGEKVFDALMLSLSAGRVTAHRMAIHRAFIDKIDNADTDVLRSADNDLSSYGHYKPSDGKFDD